MDQGETKKEVISYCGLSRKNCPTCPTPGQLGQVEQIIFFCCFMAFQVFHTYFVKQWNSSYQSCFITITLLHLFCAMGHPTKLQGQIE
jgi:hypothetical protein